MSTTDATSVPKAYQVVTERILSMLDEGTVPWHQPWATGGARPFNGATGHEYRGVNLFLLPMLGYEDPRWITFKQAKSLGGSVRKGEKGAPIVFWKVLRPADDTAEDADTTGTEEERRPRFLLRYFTGFNVSQTEGIDPDRLKPRPERRSIDHDPIPACEAIVSGFKGGPRINYGHEFAGYIPAEDRVVMPDLDTFESAERFYGVLFHELTHSTGHERRLSRRGSDVPRRFGSADYAREELVAEMGAGFLANVVGIFPAVADQSAAYIDNWRRRIGEDPTLVVKAAAAAQSAADHILGAEVTR